MSSVDIEEVFAKWAETAWTASSGDWEKAKAAFLAVADAEIDNLSPAMASAIETEVWKRFANSQINNIVQRLRSQSRVLPITPQAPSTGAAKPNKSKRTAAADAASAETVAALYMDTFYLTHGGVKLRSATFDQVTTEAQMRDKKSGTFGRDARMLFAIADKMQAEGVSAGDKRTVGSVVQDEFVERLRERTYM
ncbi:hypothetical protein LCGC14_0244120 [marine sediment metagenome]|uniref:Uncharacterized protein n=1 Tax=marine sediment metagenome TaxID=412755 RepID=A0A0F9U6J0_9ZZZZ